MIIGSETRFIEIGRNGIGFAIFGLAFHFIVFNISGPHVLFRVNNGKRDWCFGFTSEPIY